MSLENLREVLWRFEVYRMLGLESVTKSSNGEVVA
jgi:hypothetical protein